MQRELTSGSPVVKARNVPRRTELILWVRAGGRCEFDGCNEYLLRHHVTLASVKLAELAHIVAFKAEGPRGKSPNRPGDIHDIENIMLLCKRCHKLIDEGASEEKFTRETLVKYKREHEGRILRLTEAKPERKTTVVQVLTKIGGQPSRIPVADIWDAVAPRYPADEKGCVVDLNSLDDASDEFYSVAMREIGTCIDRLYSPGLLADPPKHLSVFALAPMPLLMHLGSRLSNKIPSDFYQRHRDGQNWTWKENGPGVTYSFKQRRPGTLVGRVALMLSLTDLVDMAGVVATIDEREAIFEISLEAPKPSAYFLRQRRDLEGFRRIFHEALVHMNRTHTALTAIELFPIVPAPIAITCGYELFQKVSPALRVFDRDKRRGGWSHVLDILSGA